MKKTTRILAASMALAMLPALAACGSKDSDGTEETEVQEISGNVDVEEPEDTESPEESLMLPAVNVGDIIVLGSYEQDNDNSNGAEDLEWIVLADENGKALLLSKYIIDCQVFDADDGSSTWEDSDMRAWLNGDFYESAFDEEDMPSICQTELTTKVPGVSDYITTTDKVFLLSGEDLGTYFEFDYWDETYHLGECAPALITSATEYALANGCYNTVLNGRSAAETVAAHPELDGQMSEMWWVRETGSIVGLTGDTIGNVNWQPGESLIPLSRRANVAMGVRPAIWVAVED